MGKVSGRGGQGRGTGSLVDAILSSVRANYPQVTRGWGGRGTVVRAGSGTGMGVGTERLDHLLQCAPLPTGQG